MRSGSDWIGNVFSIVVSTVVWVASVGASGQAGTRFWKPLRCSSLAGFRFLLQCCAIRALGRSALVKRLQ
jgi:hypothetical protein